MKTKIALAIVALSACPLTVAAETASPSFDYISGGFISNKFDDETLNGAGLEFSRSFNQDWFFMANIATASDSFNDGGVNFDLDLNTIAASVGYKFFNNNNATAYAFAGLVYAEAEISAIGFGNASVDDTGYNVGVGYRIRTSPNFELDGRIEGIRLMDETDVQFSARGSYFFAPQWAATAGFSFVDSDSSSFSFGVSYHF
jgi:hypothetical protein